MFLEPLEAASMGGGILGHLGPSRGSKGPFGGTLVLRGIFGGPQPPKHESCETTK